MQADGYPTNWRAYDSVVLFTGVSQFGFDGSTGDVNRFGARFRLSASYRGVVLDGYSTATADGYSALCRVLFTWSAFESFLSICDLNQKTSGPIVESYDAGTAIASIRSTDAGNRFYQFIYDRVNAAHRGELDNYFNSDPCNPGYLASAIRHIFAHGALTPNANQVDPAVVIAVCNTLCDFLMAVMDKEFARRVGDGLDDLYSR